MIHDGSITADVDLAAHFADAGVPTAKPRRKRKPKYPRITLRLSHDEHAWLVTVAEGVSISSYVRKCVFGESATPRKARARVPVKDEKALAEILARLGASKMANNLNQIAYQANCGSLLMDQQTEEEIRLACAQIAWMRVQLIEALGLKAKGS